ncbi:hypothetical protein PC128_g26422 [Phytophthora cactorum]|nr:hypothetical protein PC128_g26422 [Phytophthora cactorum]KAG4037717.1 hypothetical protein PC123_g26719 [Phytophthora cactorum]
MRLQLETIWHKARLQNTATQHLYCFVSSIYQGADRRDLPRYVELQTPASKSSSLVF